MSVVLISVMAHTDKDGEPPEFIRYWVEVALKRHFVTGPRVDEVVLLSDDHLHEGTIPAAESEYLKSHSVYDLLERLRALPDQDIGVEQLIHEAILMISALNAVKVEEAADPTNKENS